MSQKDFDLASLAVYLHITPQQVEKLASRGKVPGRKVQGKWVFSVAEIHHWMEERMGLLDEGELERVEQRLNEETIDLPLAQMLAVESIGVPLNAKSKRSVITEMVELVGKTGMLWDAERMADAIRAREELQSTALPNGVALLHPRRPLPDALGEPLLSLGISPGGIPFGGSRGLTHVFFLLGSTDDRGHLHTLARLTRLLQDDHFVPALLEAEDAAAAKAQFDEFEAALSG